MSAKGEDVSVDKSRHAFSPMLIQLWQTDENAIPTNGCELAFSCMNTRYEDTYYICTRMYST